MPNPSDVAASSSGAIFAMTRPVGAPRFHFDETGAGGAVASATGTGGAGAAAAPPSPPSPSGGASGQPPGQGAAASPPAAPYRPEGLPDHLVGASERETIDKLFGAYTGARKTIGDAGSVPEKADGYNFEPSDKLKPYVANFDKDPVYARARELARDAGMTDKVFKGFVPRLLEHFIDGGLVAEPVDPKAMLRSLAPTSVANGSDAEKDAAAAQRVKDNIAWVDGARANNTLPGPVAEFFAAMATADPRAHAAIEWLRGETVETRPAMGGQGAAGQSDTDLTERLNDPRNTPGTPRFDRAFAAETDRLYKQRYG